VLVGVARSDVSHLTKGPAHVFHDLHLFERRVQRIGSRAHGIHDGLSRGLRDSPCFLTGRARRLGGDPRLLAGDARRLGGVTQPLSLLSDRLECVAMMVADLTRFLGEAPELFRFIPGSLRSHPVFGKPTNLAVLTPVVHDIPHRQRTGSGAGEMSSTGHRMNEVVATRVDPTTALTVGLKVDADVLPAGVLEKIDLKSPATMVALRKMNAVVGLQAAVDANNHITRLGLTCALCQSTVDNSVMPRIGFAGRTARSHSGAAARLRGVSEVALTSICWRAVRAPGIPVGQSRNTTLRRELFTFNAPL
jgi:hypothetical protein